MKKKNTPTFGENGKRRIKCPKCKTYIAGKDKNRNEWVKYQYKTDNKSKNLKCPSCKTKFRLDPIKIKKLANGKNEIEWAKTETYIDKVNRLCHTIEETPQKIES
jgi:hypothetical protein